MITPEEAIKHLNAGMIITPARNGMKSLLSNTVRETAVKALEKQIPKKPIEPVEENGVELCPNCRTAGVREDYGAPNDYCSECGQAIDWGK